MLVAGQMNSRGFTVVEMLVVISIVSILGVIVFGYAQSTQLKTRDIERTSDVKAISQQFERRYRTFAATTGPTYPTTAEVSSGSISTVLLGADQEIIIAPRASSSSVLAASNTTTPQAPTIGEYIYQPFNAANNLCSVAPCVRYNLYYRQEVDNVVKTIESTRQQ